MITTAKPETAKQRRRRQSADLLALLGLAASPERFAVLEAWEREREGTLSMVGHVVRELQDAHGASQQQK